MKNKKLTKFLVPLLMVMALVFNINKVEAQSTCAGSLNGTMYSDYTQSTYQINRDSVYWIKFTAIDDSCMISLCNSDAGTHINVPNLTLYGGICSSLVINVTKNISSQDSIFISSTNLVVGNVYYLKIKNTNISNVCNFLLSIRNYNIPQAWPLYPCPEMICNNLISPYGDFNTTGGFTTAFNWSSPPTMLSPGNYTISNTATDGSPMYWIGYGVNNGGNPDNFFMADGFYNNTGSFYTAWNRSITVAPNTTYRVQFYARNLVKSSFTGPQVNPNMRLVINGTPVVLINNNTTTFDVPWTQQWYKICANWTSGPAITTANIEIQDKANANGNGNDFGLDDIALGVLVNFSATPDTCINNGDAVTLHAYGGGTYLWSTGASTSSIVVSPTTTTTYSVSITNGTCFLVYSPTVYVKDVVNFTGQFDACGGNSNYTITNYNAGYTYQYYWGATPTTFINIGTSGIFNVTYPTTSGFLANGDQLCVRGINTFCNDTTIFCMQIYPCCEKQFTPTLHDVTLTTSINSPVYLNGIINIGANISFTGALINMGPDAKIIINPGFTLTITNSSVLQAGCGRMWDGIYISNPTSQLTMDGTSKLKEAKNAMVSENGGNYLISNSTFENNYIGAIIRNYQSTFTNAKFSKTTFTSTATLLPPYSTNTRGYKGIEIESVANLCIGDTSAYNQRNTFLSLDYGITSNRTNIKVYNNMFRSIDNNTPIASYSSAPIGTCVAVRSAGSLIVNAIVGGINVSGSIKSNNMVTVECGVHGFFNLNYFKCEYDTITLQSFYNANNNPTGIYSYASNINNVNLRYNKTTGGVNGIKVVDIKASSNILVNNNFTINTPNAIAVTNVNATTIGNFTINSNQIFEPFTGILVTNCNGSKFKKVYVEANSITMTNPSFNVFTYYGIRIQNCLWPQVDQINNVLRVSTSAPTTTTAGNLNGIALETSNRAIVDRNTITRMGCGIRYEGIMPLTTTTCNTMTSCFYGVKLLLADIGNQGSVNMPWDNQWVSNYTAPGYRIHGNMSNFAPATTWYYKNGPTYNLLTGTWLVGGLFTTLLTNDGLFCGSALMGSVSNISTPLARQTAIGAVVDSIDPTTVALMGDESQYQEVKAVYGILKDEPALLDMNAIDDTKYQEFFNAAQESNIGKLNSVDSLIENDSANVANIANNNVENQNMIEFIKTTVNEIYLRTWAMGEFVLSNTDSTTLLNIAMQNPLIAGEGVFGARVMIGLQFDNYASNERITNNQTTIVPELEKTVKVYPNPAKEELSVEFSTLNTDKVLSFELYNAMGVLVYKQLFNGNDYLFKVSLNKITGGCYTYKIKDQTTIIAKDKLVIIK